MKNPILFLFFNILLFSVISCGESPDNSAESTSNTSPPSLEYPLTNYSLLKDAQIKIIATNTTGEMPIKCISSPALPKGLSIDSTSCDISGAPTIAQGATDYTITVSNTEGSATEVISIEIGLTATLNYTDSSYIMAQSFAMPNVTPNLSGDGPINCTSSPEFPNGLLINKSTCVISGTPTTVQNTTTYTITASNKFGDATADVSITIILDSDDPTVSIQNLEDKGTVLSGFITGNATDNTMLSIVEISLDNGPYIAVTGSTTWRYQLPSGANIWRDNTQHTISVRAKDIAGNISDGTTLSVRKGKNTDVNGDGYSDLVVGAESYDNDVALNSSEGRVYIYHSNGVKGISATVPIDADSTITGIARSSFGCTVALGDINGDGYADLVVAKRSSSSGSNPINHQPYIYVFYSSGSSGITATNLNQANTAIDYFNKCSYGSLALGDINGDGYSDIVAATRCSSIYSMGQVLVFHSSGANGITTTSYTEADTVLKRDKPSNESDEFGSSISLGDVNGDGFTDLAVGDSRKRYLYIFHSSGTNGITATTDTDANTTIAITASGGSLNTVAFGDVNGDGYADLAVGSRSYRSQSGAVYVFHSTGVNGITATDGQMQVDYFIRPLDLGDYQGFGSSLSFGDINGDGYDDLAVGATGNISNWDHILGKAYVFYSAGSNGITSSIAHTIIVGGYSMKVALGDVNGDGYSDLAISNSRYGDPAYFKVHIFHNQRSHGLRIDSELSVQSINQSHSTISDDTYSLFGDVLVW